MIWDVLEKERSESLAWHAHWYRARNCNCFLLSTALGIPLPTITLSFKNMTLFPLILDQHVCVKFPVSGLKIPRPQILLHTSFWPFSSICDSRVSTSSDETPSCTIPIRSSNFSDSLILNMYECHQGGILPQIIKFRSILYQIPEYYHSEVND